MKHPPLSECPFCKSLCLSYTSNGHESNFVMCDDCGADGPTAKTKEGAAYVWNNRVKKNNDSY